MCRFKKKSKCIVRIVETHVFCISFVSYQFFQVQLTFLGSAGLHAKLAENNFSPTISGQSQLWAGNFGNLGFLSSAGVFSLCFDDVLEGLWLSEHAHLGGNSTRIPKRRHENRNFWPGESKKTKFWAPQLLDHPVLCHPLLGRSNPDLSLRDRSHSLQFVRIAERCRAQPPDPECPKLLL